VSILALAATSVLATATNVSAATNRTPASSKQVINIAQSFDTIDSSRQSEITSENANIAAFNKSSSQYIVKLTTYNSQQSVATQIATVQTALLKKPNVLIIVPVDSVGSLAAVRLAKKAGVPVINESPTYPLNSLYTAAFEGSNETLYDAGTVTYIKDYLASHPKVHLNMGLIYGGPAQTPQLGRVKAVIQLAKKMPRRITVLATAYGDWLTATAQNITEDWFTAYPKMNWVGCANDIMATGAANAVALAHKKPGQVMVSGYDLTPAGLQRVENGTEAVDVGAPNAYYGWIIPVAIEVALGKLKGSYAVSQVLAATRANVHKMISLANAIYIPFPGKIAT
jgi:ABC-type sugar transport system substrate-binding protein